MQWRILFGKPLMLELIYIAGKLGYCSRYLYR
jgi:hypothetical protein